MLTRGAIGLVATTVAGRRQTGLSFCGCHPGGSKAAKYGVQSRQGRRHCSTSGCLIETRTAFPTGSEYMCDCERSQSMT